MTTQKICYTCDAEVEWPRKKCDTCRQSCLSCGEATYLVSGIRRCRSCRAAVVRKFKASPTGSVSNKLSKAASKYGITKGEALRLYESPCGSCGDTESRIHIDHDHDTGKVRGALCAPCNKALGFLRDDPDKILALLSYLRSSQ